MCKFMLTVTALVCAALACQLLGAKHGVLAQDKKQPDKNPILEMDNLMWQLESADEKARESAASSLRKIGEPALYRLLAVSKNGRVSIGAGTVELGADTRKRCRQLWDQIKTDVAEARAKYRAARDKRLADRLAKETSLGIDYFVGRMVRDCQKLTDDDWDLIAMMEERLKKEGTAEGIKDFEILDYLNYQWKKVTAKDYEPEEFGRTLRCVGADSIKASRAFYLCMLVSKNSLESSSPIATISLIGKGAQTRFGSVGRSVLLVNGNFETNAPMDDTVIVASGDVKARVLTRVLVIAGGKVESTSPVKCVFRENARTVIDGIGFFAPEKLGLDVVAEGDAVEVRKVADNSAFAQAGFKAGDKITAVNGEKVQSLASFREWLREAVLTKEGEFAITRGKEQMKKRVQFKVE